jgi:hypothetical protein
VVFGSAWTVVDLFVGLIFAVHVPILIGFTVARYEIAGPAPDAPVAG